ncbi:MAG: Prolipoprotein diacylglyceryl transferase [Candidatus Angelobacter sp.]|jgi:phosphatidylglycerol:prolipoprotein diacylglycerol transferase|nr:Prolipoprotein diacylglyceryl transferase [Candidatus Angelobacter sp.]
MIPFINIGPLSVGTFGLMMWAAFVVAYFVLNADFRRRNFTADPQMVIGVSAVAGVVGAKIYHVLESPSQLMAAPFSTIFSRSGFAWFGGFIAGLLALIYFARRYQIPVLTFLDACAPATAAGYAVGRIGCLLSGDGDYGQPTSLPWGMSFPPPALVPSTTGVCPEYGLPADCRVHPTPIYEFIVGMVLAYILWKLGEKVIRAEMPQGIILAAFLILSGLARFLVEFIRINPRIYLGLSNAQLASLASIVAGIFVYAMVRRHPVLAGQDSKPLRQSKATRS